MKKLYSLILATIVTSTIISCGNGNKYPSSAENGSNYPQAIIPPSMILIAQAHVASSEYYNTKTNTPYYQAYTLTNKAAKAIPISSIAISANSTEFQIETESTSYPAGQIMCTNGLSLNNKASCEIVVSIKNPTAISNSIVNGTLAVSAIGQTYQKSISKTSYAYVAGSFSHAYANNAESVPATTATNTFTPNLGCGPSQDKDCQLLAFNLATHNLTSIMKSDYRVNSMAVGADGNIYVAGQLTQAHAGSTQITEPTAGSLVLSVNPALVNSSGGLTDLIANSSETVYPDQEVYALGYANNSLYLTGGFQNIANISATDGYPVVRYNTLGSPGSAWSNIFTQGNPDQGVSVLKVAGDNLYIAGLYTKLDNTVYNPTPYIDYGKFPINHCTTSDNGVTYTCSPTDFVFTDGTGASDVAQPAASINFDSQGNLYIAGGFSAIGNVGNPATTDFMIATSPSGSFDDLSNATWNSSFVGINFPNNVLSAVVPYEVNKFYAGGYFSSIGGIPASDTETGMCGTGALSWEGTQSCLVANYDGTNFNKMFTTDGWINTIVYANQISGN